MRQTYLRPLHTELNKVRRYQYIYTSNYPLIKKSTINAFNSYHAIVAHEKKISDLYNQVSLLWLGPDIEKFNTTTPYLVSKWIAAICNNYLVAFYLDRLEKEKNYLRRKKQASERAFNRCFRFNKELNTYTAVIPSRLSDPNHFIIFENNIDQLLKRSDDTIQAVKRFKTRSIWGVKEHVAHYAIKAINVGTYIANGVIRLINFVTRPFRTSDQALTTYNFINDYKNFHEKHLSEMDRMSAAQDQHDLKVDDSAHFTDKRLFEHIERLIQAHHQLWQKVTTFNVSQLSEIRHAMQEFEQYYDPGLFNKFRYSKQDLNVAKRKTFDTIKRNLKNTYELAQPISTISRIADKLVNNVWNVDFDHDCYELKRALDELKWADIPENSAVDYLYSHGQRLCSFLLYWKELAENIVNAQNTNDLFYLIDDKDKLSAEELYDLMKGCGLDETFNRVIEGDARIEAAYLVANKARLLEALYPRLLDNDRKKIESISGINGNFVNTANIDRERTGLYQLYDKELENLNDASQRLIGEQQDANLIKFQQQKTAVDKHHEIVDKYVWLNEQLGAENGVTRALKSTATSKKATGPTYDGQQSITDIVHQCSDFLTYYGYDQNFCVQSNIQRAFKVCSQIDKIKGLYRDIYNANQNGNTLLSGLVKEPENWQQQKRDYLELENSLHNLEGEGCWQQIKTIFEFVDNHQNHFQNVKNLREFSEQIAKLYQSLNDLEAKLDPSSQHAIDELKDGLTYLWKQANLYNSENVFNGLLQEVPWLKQFGIDQLAVEHLKADNHDRVPATLDEDGWLSLSRKTDAVRPYNSMRSYLNHNLAADRLFDLSNKAIRQSIEQWLADCDADPTRVSKLLSDAQSILRQLGCHEQQLFVDNEEQTVIDIWTKLARLVSLPIDNHDCYAESKLVEHIAQGIRRQLTNNEMMNATVSDRSLRLQGNAINGYLEKQDTVLAQAYQEYQQNGDRSFLSQYEQAISVRYWPWQRVVDNAYELRFAKSVHDFCVTFRQRLERNRYHLDEQDREKLDDQLQQIDDLVENNPCQLLRIRARMVGLASSGVMTELVFKARDSSINYNPLTTEEDEFDNSHRMILDMEQAVNNILHDYSEQVLLETELAICRLVKSLDTENRNSLLSADHYQWDILLALLAYHQKYQQVTEVFNDYVDKLALIRRCAHSKANYDANHLRLQQISDNIAYKHRSVLDSIDENYSAYGQLYLGMTSADYRSYGLVDKKTQSKHKQSAKGHDHHNSQSDQVSSGQKVECDHQPDKTDAQHSHNATSDATQTGPGLTEWLCSFFISNYLYPDDCQTQLDQKGSSSPQNSHDDITLNCNERQPHEHVETSSQSDISTTSAASLSSEDNAHESAKRPDGGKKSANKPAEDKLKQNGTASNSRTTKRRQKTSKTNKQSSLKNTKNAKAESQKTHKSKAKKPRRIIEFDDAGCGVYFFPSTGERIKCSRFSLDRKLPKSHQYHKHLGGKSE